MTVVGAIQGTYENEGCLVFYADSMGTFADKTKVDNVQKIFLVDQYLVAATGNLNITKSVVASLQRHTYKNLDEFSENCRSFAARLPPQEMHSSFILGGKDECYKTHIVRCTEHKGEVQWRIDKRPSWNKVEGSGSHHVIRHIDAYHALGIPAFDDLTNAFSYAYEFGMKGATDTAVNEKLQYGIMTKKGISLLYHSDLQDTDTLSKKDKEYLRLISSMPDIDDTFCDKIWHVMREVYYAIESDAHDYVKAKRRFRSAASRYAQNAISKELETAFVEQRKAYHNLEEGIHALVERTIPALLQYKWNFMRRKQDIDIVVQKKYDSSF